MRRAGLASTIPALSVAALVTSLVLGAAPAASAAPTPPAPPASPASGGVGNHLVALGDSWAAGSAAGDVDRTTGPCRRSTQAYPPRVAAGLGQLRWISRACATAAGPGPTASAPATTPTTPTTPAKPSTPAKPPKPAKPSAPAEPGTSGVGSTLGAALDSSAGGALTGALGGVGGRAEGQFGVVDPNTRAVVATVGGDAVGLGALARACSTAGTAAACDAAAGRTDRALTALPRTLDGSLAEMRRRAPASVIVLSGYPHLTEGVACAKGAADLARAARVDAVVDRLDGVLAARAGAARARFVDVRPAFRGHGACAPEAWLTPFTGPDALLAGGPTTLGQSRGYVPAVLAAVAGAPAAPSAAASTGARPSTRPTTRPAPDQKEAGPQDTGDGSDGRVATDADLTEPLFAG